MKQRLGILALSVSGGFVGSVIYGLCYPSDVRSAVSVFIGWVGASAYFAFFVLRKSP